MNALNPTTDRILDALATAPRVTTEYAVHAGGAAYRVVADSAEAAGTTLRNANINAPIERVVSVRKLRA